MPLVGETESHVESLMAVKLSVLPPVFVTLIVLAARVSSESSVCEKESVAGETERAGVGVGAATLKVTVTLAGEFCAPVATEM